MELYWQTVVDNILGGSAKTDKSGTSLPAKSSCSRKTTKVVKKPDVQPGEAGSSKSKKSKSRKTVKFNEEKSAARDKKNISLTSDEGIDVSYTPLSTIPKVIQRPQHHLKTSWTFWYSAGNKNLSWEQNQVKISTVSTIEQFWLVVNQLKSPSSIPVGHTYSVFRAGVAPDWEDMSNMEGGRWMVSCPKVERKDGLDTKWLEILFMIVGENVKDSSGLVNGAEACVRKKEDRLEVWVNDVTNMRGVVDIGRMIKSKLGLDCSRRMKFSLHKEDKAGVKGPRLAL